MASTRYTDRPNLRCWFPALSSLISAALRSSATFDTTLAGTQQVHPCMFRCAIMAHMASTRYTERSIYAAGSQLPAPSSQLPAPSSQLSALGSRLSALGSRLSALGSRLSALGSRLSALGSRLSALGS